MLLQRLVVAASVAGLAPVASVQADDEAVTDTAVPSLAVSAQDYYRMQRAPQATGHALLFDMAATVRPATVPGSTAWLSRRGAEPLAASYAAPYAARKEVGISYSSDGRMNAYLAQPEHRADAPSADGSESDCCVAMPPGSRYAKGVESPAVTSLLARLKARGLKLTLDDGWKLNAGARSREYSNSLLNTRIGQITLQRWWGDWNTAFSLQFEKRGGWDLAPSQSFQLGYAFAPRSTAAVSYTAGQEIAFFGPRGMMKTEVHALALQAEHAVEKNWSIRFDAGYYDHGELPSHKMARIAFRWSL